MANLETNYLGLKLKNPLIISSSGFTDSVTKIQQAETMGAAAVVIKSVFEEQINKEADNYQSMSVDNAEAYDYLQGYVTANGIDKHLRLIQEAKNKVSIPIIASINCFSDKKWIEFAKHFEEVGADALELNIYIMPDDRNQKAEDIEKQYIAIVKKIVKKVNIPVAVKLSNNFTNVVNIVERLKAVGVKGVVLFNRFYEPDIDINNMEMKSANIFTSSNDFTTPLRWTSILSSQLKNIDISATTGIHNYETAAKMILAGANTFQICSVLYKNGIKEINEILNGLNSWLGNKHFRTLDEARGAMNYKQNEHKNFYQRSQFMKYYSNNK